MSTSSNLDRICVAALALAVLIAALAFCAPALGYEAASGGVVLGYEERLFDTSVVHTIDIVMDDWEGFIAGCEDEEYVLCDLVIDGEDWGLYLAVEGVEESFLLCNYGTDYGEFERLFDETVELISPYVERGPTKFCTYEEFELGAETLREFCLLRAESIGYQLAGEDVTVDASGLDISAMGSMNNTAGGGGKGFRG